MLKPSIQNIRLAALLLAVFLGLTHAEDTSMPAPLKTWKSPDYSRRYFLKVEAPGEAGNVGLQADAMFASVMLPLKVTGEGAAQRVEPVALVGEDGLVQPVYVHTVAGGSETEVVFATYPGQRRFCLYAGAAKTPALFSPEQLHPAPLLVRLRGMTADPSFIPDAKKPLTLDRFLQMEQEKGTPLLGVKTLSVPDPHPEIQPNIDDAECPYAGVQYDIFDRISAVINPQNYAALYEGFLRCPIAGKYKFAIDTPGAAHVIIDGVPIISAEQPDEHRDAFALNKTLELAEGVHRVVVHFAEANPAGDKRTRKTNADLRRFGLRLHWQPPFANELLCIPPLAFVKYLPGVVAACEHAPAAAGGATADAAFIHVETIGHVRASAHKGDDAAREFVLACARTANLASGATLRFKSAGMEDVLGQPGQRILCAWVPAGQPIEFKIDGADEATRTLLWPTLKTGVKEFIEREVMDLEAELLVKSAPEFLYPNETGHIHLEAVLSPKPEIVHKTRFDAKEVQPAEMLPPPPRPMGEFNLFFEQYGTSASGSIPFAATPDDSERKKIRVSFPAQLNSEKTVSATLQLRFVVGGIECQNERFRLLHARTPSWPGRLVFDSGDLAFEPSGPGGAPDKNAPAERVVILVPHEDEASHRRLKPLDAFSSAGGTTDALFIGDPLVEGVVPVKDYAPSSGLDLALSKAKPAIKWKVIETAGPHRYRPLLQMLADLDALSATLPDRKLPATAIVNLGSGDVARQTPLHIFERALDTLLARLNAGGVERVLVVGVIPEPWREKQCEPYEERVANVVKQHHVSGINLLQTWTREADWTRRFTPTGQKSDVAGPVPNKATIDELVEMILSRM